MVNQNGQSIKGKHLKGNLRVKGVPNHYLPSLIEEAQWPDDRYHSRIDLRCPTRWSHPGRNGPPPRLPSCIHLKVALEGTRLRWIPEVT